MMGWLRRLLGLCPHEWETFAQADVCRVGCDTPWALMYMLRCKKCGDVKGRKIGA